MAAQAHVSVRPILSADAVFSASAVAVVRAGAIRRGVLSLAEAAASSEAQAGARLCSVRS